jgi:hypothetical protein
MASAFGGGHGDYGRQRCGMAGFGKGIAQVEVIGGVANGGRKFGENL